MILWNLDSPYYAVYGGEIFDGQNLFDCEMNEWVTNDIAEVIICVKVCSFMALI